jgi:hypothetical protein
MVVIWCIVKKNDEYKMSEVSYCLYSPSISVLSTLLLRQTKFAFNFYFPSYIQQTHVSAS